MDFLQKSSRFCWVHCLSGEVRILGVMGKILAYALAVLSCSAHAKFDHPDLILESVTKLSAEYDRLTRDFSPGDIVVFDLDNTVFREVQMLGTDEWYSHQLHQFRKGRTRSEAVKLMEPLNVAIKSVTDMKLMEPEIPSLIQRLQSRGIIVIGLTARHPRLAESTLGQLHKFGIDFSKSAWPEHALKDLEIRELPNSLSYRGGIAFTDGATKGIVLRHLLVRTKSRPSRIAAIDDRIHHMESYVETIQEFNASGRLIHYLKALEEEPFDPLVATVQELVFEKLGLLLSDEKARDLVSQRENWDTKNWTCSRLLTRRWN